MTVHWFDLLWGLTTPPLWSVGMAQLGHQMRLRWFRLRASFYATFLTWWRYAVGSVVIALVLHAWMLAAGYTVSVAVAFALTWYRKNRRRVNALAGAKSRALRDALVARMPKPRPVLVPGGAA